MNKIPWLMRLTLVNAETKEESFVMYPCSKYEMLESMDCCGLPYGSGSYIHLMVGNNPVVMDRLQYVLGSVIEHPDHPPSIRELNYLGTQIQKMSDQDREHMAQTIETMNHASIVEAINLTHKLLQENNLYDGLSLAGREVLLEENEPYTRFLLAPEDMDYEDAQKTGVWRNTPVDMADLEKISRQFGLDSIQSLEVIEVDTVIEKIGVDMAEDFDSLNGLNQLAKAM